MTGHVAPFQQQRETDHSCVRYINKAIEVKRFPAGGYPEEDLYD
jgi:hypothetical protein